MEIAKLETMSLKELRALRSRIDDAIRFVIAQSRVAPKPSAAPAPKLDLERERDAWKARKHAVDATVNVVSTILRSE